MGSLRIGERQIIQLPDGCRPVGLLWLLERYALDVPVPGLVSCSAAGSERHVVPLNGRDFRLIRADERPEDTLEGHLLHALRNEPLNLLALDRLFAATGPAPIEAIVAAGPTGPLRRRLWFFYEWLREDRLGLEDAQGNYVPAVAPEEFFTVQGRNSRRHRVVDNLPGVRGFCPMIRRTPVLEAFIAEDLGARARTMMGALSPMTVARAVNYLYSKESRTSFAIEGERPVEAKLQAFARLLRHSGQAGLDAISLTNLQNMTVDARFKEDWFRQEAQVYVGDNMDIVYLIGAKPADLPGLMSAWAGGVGRLMQEGADPILAAATASFGFVNIHPFEDGNGRISRFMIHHVLKRMKYGPEDGIFPVSAPIYRQMPAYHAALDSWSRPMMEMTDYQLDPDGIMTVTSDTRAYYSYYDATKFAEFIYGCVKQTVDLDLPWQIDFIRRYDQAAEAVEAIVTLPDAAARMAIRGVVQEGRLSKNLRKKDPLSRLRGDECDRIEAAIQAAFAGYQDLETRIAAQQAGGAVPPSSKDVRSGPAEEEDDTSPEP